MKSLLVVLLLMITITGCNKNKGSVDTNGVPATLVIGAVQTEGFDQIKKIRLQVCAYLSKKLGIPVTIIYSSDYDGVIEALKSNKIHVAYLPPFAYVIATRVMHLTPMVTLGSNGKPTTYHSVIIVNGNSNLKSMQDVKSHSKSLTFCFVDPASTSGHLVPRGYLNSIGLNPDTAFKQTIFAGTHPSSILSVKSGKIDVGCTTDLVFGIMLRAKMIKKLDIRVLWKSDPIIGEPIVIRNDINEDFVKKVQSAYLDMNKEAPEILKSYIKFIYKDSIKRSYIVVQDSMYNGLRKIAAGIKGLKAN